MSETIKCAECGGTKVINIGENQYRCLYCGATFRLDSETPQSTKAQIPPQPQVIVINQPATNFPELEFAANFNKGLNSQGGKLYITSTQLIFRPHSFNLGNLDEKVYEIKDITGYKKGFLTFFYIMFRNGSRIKLTVNDKSGVIQALEERRKYLCK